MKLLPKPIANPENGSETLEPVFDSCCDSVRINCSITGRLSDRTLLFLNRQAMTRLSLLLLLFILTPVASASNGLIIESITLQTPTSPVDRYGNWQLRKVRAQDIEPELADALQRRQEVPVGDSIEGNPDYRVLGHDALHPGSDGALYHSLEWVIDEQIHRTIWYHLYDGRADKQAMQQLKSEFYSTVPADQVKNPARHIYDGDNDWPFDFIDYLASNIETAVIRIRLANRGHVSLTVSDLRFTHQLSSGGDADAEIIATNLRPGIESAVLDWREQTQVFGLGQPLRVAPGEEAALEFTIKVKDAAQGDSGGMLLTLLELGYLTGDESGTLFTGALLLHDSLDDLAY